MEMVEVQLQNRAWIEVHRRLCDVAKRRGVLDAEEAELLCAAARDEIWRRLGRASLLEYLEEVLGYSPRQAKERVRVATELATMPELAEALATGEQSFSAIRELTRIATPESQRQWRDAMRGKNLRQIEAEVTGRRKGALPGDAPRPQLGRQALELELTPATRAKLRHVRQLMTEQDGNYVDDDALVDKLCGAFLAGTGPNDQASYQVLAVVCERCRQGFIEGGGVRIAVSDADRDRAECDCDDVTLDGTVTRTLTTKKRRAIRLRDGGKCAVPTCRASSHLEIHHIVPREEGGDHALPNLTLLCDGHHRARHEGFLSITGTAPELAFAWTNQPPAARVDVKSATPQLAASGASGATSHGDACPEPRPTWGSDLLKLERVALTTEVKDAVEALGFTAREARAAVEVALPKLERPTFETLLLAAVACCPKPG